jgi:hypothetical protein
MKKLKVILVALGVLVLAFVLVVLGIVIGIVTFPNPEKAPTNYDEIPESVVYLPQYDAQIQ